MNEFDNIPMYCSSPQCPFCGHKVRDAWDINFGPSAEGDTEITCGGCEREYQCFCHVEVTYSAYKKEEVK